MEQHHQRQSHSYIGAKAVGIKHEDAIPVDTVAREIAFAIKQPAEVDVNENVLRSALQDD